MAHLAEIGQGSERKWHFNDYPYGVLACETYAILYALDLQGMHQEAADGLDQWLSLPMQTKIEPGKGGHMPRLCPIAPWASSPTAKAV